MPKTAKEVHSFIGLASYYQRFIDNFAKKATPLHALIGPIATKKKAHNGHQTNTTQLPLFEWKEEHEQSFQSLKDALVTAPVLGYPDYTKPFMLETDASLKGLRAVLSQRSDDGEIRPIAYAS